MKKRFDYPAFIAVANLRCLIAGFGNVGRRKFKGLLDAGARYISILDPGLHPIEFEDLEHSGQILAEARCCTKADILDSELVFACTSSKEENARIAQICADNRILCNAASDPDQSSFLVPAIARKDGLMIAFSTAGQSPILAKKWRVELESWLEDKYRLAWLLGKLRQPLLNAGYTQKENAALLAAIAGSPIQEWLLHWQLEKCVAWLNANCPPPLQKELPAIFTEYEHVFS